MIKRHPALLASLFIFLITFLVYFFSMSFYPSGYADADEIATASYLWSVPHPPGYPLQVFIWGLVMRLLPFFSPIFLANILSGFSLALGISLIANGLMQILPKSRLAVSTAALLIAFSGPFWLFAGLSEIYAFALALVSLTLFFAFKFFTVQNPHLAKKYLIGLLVFSALSVSHLQTAVFILPSLAYLLFIRRKMLISLHLFRFNYLFAGLLLWLFCFFLPYAILFPLNAHHQPFSWYFAPTLSGWLGHIFRHDYSGFFPEEVTSRPAYLLIPGLALLRNLPGYINLFFHQLQPFVFGLSLFGLVIMFFIHKPLAWFNFFLVLFPGFLFPLFLSLPQNSSDPAGFWLNLAVTQRQFLLGFFVCLPSVSFALWFLFGYLPNRLRWANLLLALVLIGLTLLVNFPVGYQRPNRIVNSYAKSALAQASPNSLIICTMDISCYSLIYAHYVDHQRQDVAIIPKNSLYSRYYFSNKPELYPFNNLNNPDFTANLMSYQLLKRPVYLTEATSYYLQNLGLNGDPFYLVPSGNLFQVATFSAGILPKVSDQGFGDIVSRAKPSPLDYYQIGLKAYFAQLEQFTAELTNNYGQPELTQQRINLIHQYLKNVPFVTLNLNQAISATPAAHYSPELSVSTVDLFKRVKNAYQSQDYQLAYDLLKKLVMLQPLNSQSRAMLTYLLYQGGFQAEATAETKNLKALNPEITDPDTYIQTMGRLFQGP